MIVTGVETISGHVLILTMKAISVAQNQKRKKNYVYVP